MTKVAVLLVIGVLLIFFGLRGGASSVSTETPDATQTEEEALAKICSAISGVGECRVIIGYTPATRATERRVESVCVVCRGAGSAKVRERLSELLSSLYGIGTNRIYIAPLD